MAAFAAGEVERAGGVRARHDGRHQRAARAARRAHGARDDARLPRRARDRPPGPRRPLRPHRGAGRRRSCRASCASASRERMGPDGELAAARRGRASRRRSTRCARRTSRRSPSACSSRSCIPEHEQARRRGAARGAARTCTSRSPREVLPEFREYERFSTTTADAYLAPRLAAYLRRLARPGGGGGRARAARDAVVGRRGRRGDGERGRRRLHPLRPGRRAWSGAAHVARASGYEDLLTFDMGGTSTDVAPVHRRRGAAPRRSPWSPACRSRCRWSTCTR